MVSETKRTTSRFKNGSSHKRAVLICGESASDDKAHTAMKSRSEGGGGGNIAWGPRDKTLRDERGVGQKICEERDKGHDDNCFDDRIEDWGGR